MSNWGPPSRRRRVDRAADALALPDDVAARMAEDHALRMVGRRSLIEAINRHAGREVEPVPAEVSAEVEAAAERARRRIRDTSTPAEREERRRQQIADIEVGVAHLQAVHAGRPAPTPDEDAATRRDVLAWLDRHDRQ